MGRILSSLGSLDQFAGALLILQLRRFRLKRLAHCAGAQICRNRIARYFGLTRHARTASRGWGTTERHHLWTSRLGQSLARERVPIPLLVRPLRIDGPVWVRRDPLSRNCLPNGALGTPSVPCVCSNRDAH